jgi:hypothetical protein
MRTLNLLTISVSRTPDRNAWYVWFMDKNEQRYFTVSLYPCQFERDATYTITCTCTTRKLDRNGHGYTMLHNPHIDSMEGDNTEAQSTIAKLCRLPGKK